jgi:hypothetical protein
MHTFIVSITGDGGPAPWLHHITLRHKRCCPDRRRHTCSCSPSKVAYFRFIYLFVFYCVYVCSFYLTDYSINSPSLTWRDVQHIIVHAAKHIDPSHSGWAQNGAGHMVS